ncbi:phosphate propanoyltransferase [Candidatus Pacearchaeota archaeon]|nr:phosphate propanoyltransferase [Candidatus Pacearchaeota archaeon]
MNLRKNTIIPIEISARHIHLSQKDLEELFGIGYKLKKFRELSQFGEFASEEKVTIKNGLKKIENVRIIGPVRKETQVEISHADARFLGINPPIRISGNIENTPGIDVISKKEITLKKGVIIPMRHIHCNPKEAKELGIEERTIVSVKTNSPRTVTFHNIPVKIKETYKLSLHLDIDEGNSAGIIQKGEGTIINIENK